MFFVKPTILRDDVQARFETSAKYNYIRDLQMTTRPDTVMPSWEDERPEPVVMPVLQEPTEQPEVPTIDLRKLTPPEEEPTED